MVDKLISLVGTFVAKFGGGPMSTAGLFALSVARILADPNIRHIVVSAPGKVAGGDKVTDLLIACFDLASNGNDFTSKFHEIVSRFNSIIKGLPLTACFDLASSKKGFVGKFREMVSRFDSIIKSIPKCSLKAEYADLEEKLTALKNGDSTITRDWIMSRGEFMTAKLMATVLNATFIDPEECIIIDQNGNIVEESYDLLRKKLEDSNKRYVIPGFYGSDGKGNIRVLPRSGSDITGAIVSVAVGATLYINIKDVEGVAVADPNIVGEKVTYLPHISYDLMYEAAGAGAEVLSRYAVKPVQDAGISIKFEGILTPNAFGTFVNADRNMNAIIIAGRKNCMTFKIHKDDINNEVGFGMKALKIFAESKIPYIHNATGETDILIVIAEDEAKKINNDQIFSLLTRELSAEIETIPLSVITIASEGKAVDPIFIRKVADILDSLHLKFEFISAVGKKSIVIGINPDHFEEVIKALYRICR